MRWVLVVGLCLLLAPRGVRAQSPDDASDGRRIATRVHDEGGYADDLSIDPGNEGNLFAGEGGWSDEGRVEPVDDVATGEREAGDDASDWHVPLPAWLRDIIDALSAMLRQLFGAFGVLAGPVAYLVIGVGICGAIMFLVALIAMIRFPARSARQASAGGGVGRSGTRDPLLDDQGMSAEELATQGRFGEAIRALFLRNLRQRVQVEGRVKESTARELVRESAREHRPLLDGLLGETELVWFGGRRATRDDFERALAIERGPSIESGVVR